MEWFVWALLGAVFWGVSALFAKFVVSHEVEQPFVIAVYVGLALFCGLGVGSWLLGAGLASLEWWPVLVGCLYALTLVVFYRGMETEAVSRFAPTVGLSGVFVLVLAMSFLDEMVSLVGGVAALSVIGGGVLLSLEDPLHDLSELHSSTGFYLGLLCAFLFAVRDVLVKSLSGLGYPSLLLGIAVGGLAAVFVMAFVYFRSVVDNVWITWVVGLSICSVWGCWLQPGILRML